MQLPNGLLKSHMTTAICQYFHSS